MKSRFVRRVYEKNGFCIYAYHTEDASVPQGARSSYYKGDGCEFTAVGNNLPANRLSEVDLHGDWEKNSHGVQFKVDYFEEIRPQSVEGIESYLASGMVKGIGPKTAKLIVGSMAPERLKFWMITRSPYWRSRESPGKNWIKYFRHIRTVMRSGIWQRILLRLR